MGTFTAMQRQALKLHAAGVILTGHNIAWARLRTDYSTHHEPVFAAYLCASLSYLATPWRAELRQIDPNARLTISSVFTHQRPYVTYANGGIPQQCELSDVMIALIDRTDTSNIRSRCFFVQAKRDDSPSVTLSKSNDLVQLHLYTNRPTFDVKRKNAPRSISFPAVAHVHDTALNYGITPPTDINTKVTPAAWGIDRWKLANKLNGHASATITATVPLQDLLVDFLDGCAGFDFILSSPGDSWAVLDNAGQSWSALINFILQDAVNAKSPRYAPQSWSRRSDGGRALSVAMFDSHGIPYVTVNQDPTDRTWHLPNYRVTLADQLLQNLQSNREPPHDDPPRADGEHDDGQWGGMSVVLMEMSARNN